jgi:hypothetical protein
VVRRIIRHTEMIKNDINAPECFKEMQVIFFGEAPGRNAGLFSTYYYRRSMVVGPTDEYDLLACSSQVPDIKIRRDIGTGGRMSPVLVS